MNIPKITELHIVVAIVTAITLITAFVMYLETDPTKTNFFWNLIYNIFF